MRLFDIRAAADFRLHDGPEKPAVQKLSVDDLLSRGSDGLGLDVDAEGRLVLFEGPDFD